MHWQNCTFTRPCFSFVRLQWLQSCFFLTATIKVSLKLTKSKCLINHYAHQYFFCNLLCGPLRDTLNTFLQALLRTWKVAGMTDKWVCIRTAVRTLWMLCNMSMYMIRVVSSNCAAYWNDSALCLWETGKYLGTVRTMWDVIFLFRFSFLAFWVRLCYTSVFSTLLSLNLSFSNVRGVVHFFFSGNWNWARLN